MIAATCRYNGRMRWRPTFPFTILVLLAVACASQGGSGARSEKTAAAKKAPGCDNFAHPCSAEEACIDGTCRTKGCSSDGDCGQNAACMQGWCIVRQCTENLGCLGDDQTAGTADDRS